MTILGSKVGYVISKEAVSEGLEHDWNTISITVDNRELSVSINNVTVIQKEADLMPNAGFFVPRRGCLFSIGFKQLGSTAYYDNLFGWVCMESTKQIYSWNRASQFKLIFNS